MNKINWWLKYKTDIENHNHQAGRIVLAVKKVKLFYGTNIVIDKSRRCDEMGRMDIKEMWNIQ